MYLYEEGDAPLPCMLNYTKLYIIESLANDHSNLYHKESDARLDFALCVCMCVPVL